MLSSNSIKLGVRQKLKKKAKQGFTKDPVRVKLSHDVGKICAYLHVGKKEEAKVWAQSLVANLRRLGLLD